MADTGAFDFEIKAIRRRHVDLAQHYALSPLTGPRHKGEVDREAKIVEATLKLIEQWRARVYALRAEGWKRPTGKSLIYTLNCPPVGVLTNRQKLRPCNQYAVCPFCWCRRYVEETFNRLENAYYGEERKQPLKLDLVEVTTTERLPTDEWTLPLLFELIQDHRADYLRNSLPNEGAFQLYSIEPPDSRSQSTVSRWKFQQRILAMIDPVQENPSNKVDFVGQRRVVRRYNGIIRKKLGIAVGRACRYPKQMMHGPKATVAELLEMRRNWGGEGSKGFRMSGYCGLLRNNWLGKREI